MQCIAVDDEPLALQIVEDYISKIPFLELIGSFSDALEAIEYLGKHNVDLIFLDIQMPNLTGIEFINTIKQPPLFIFTTAYNQYALKGFELSAIDYLLKPFGFERFLQASNKAHEIFQLRNKGKSSPSLEKGPQLDYILVKADYQTIRINFDDIYYIESMADYIRIYTANKKITALATLKGVMDILPDKLFMRIHRSYIISLNMIDSFNKRNVQLGEYTLPIGETYRNDFEERMGQRLIG